MADLPGGRRKSGKTNLGSVAAYLAEVAKDRNRRTVTYGDLQKEFGRIAQSWGKPLTDIVGWCAAKRVPLLPVLVVRKGEEVPPNGATVYREVGLLDDADLIAEQERCRAYDWSSVDFTDVTTMSSR